MSCRRANWMMLVMLLLWTSQAWAQDAQELTYHSGSMTLRSEGIGYQTIYLTSQVPPDVELPKFRSSKTVFGKWMTPMAPGGYLWVAFDRSGWRKSYDRLYIDTNCNGSLKDEKVITGRVMARSSSSFTPVTVRFPGASGPLEYALNMSLYNYGDRPMARIRSACWYGGEVTVGGVKYECLLMDYNANGTFNDKSLDLDKSDRIKLQANGEGETTFVGNFVMVDGRLYRPDIARDGSSIALSEANDVTFGTLRVPTGISEIAFGGENGKFVFRPGGGLKKAPVGKYRVLSWAIEQKDEKNRAWKLSAINYGDKGVIDLEEAAEPNLAVGQPVISQLAVNRNRSGYQVNHKLVGRMDEEIGITCDGRSPAAPKVRVRNADGSYNKLFNLEYG
jgi:hypothetical protein